MLSFEHMDRRRLLGYLLLNALVSALVTGTILFFYDRAYRADCSQAVLIPTLPAVTDATPQADRIRMDIIGVVGAGTESGEIVIIKNGGEEAVILTGWQLQDSNGNAYIFPQLTLYPAATLQVHTAGGEDTATDLYWDRGAAVWQPGEIAMLYDSQGILRALYRVP